MNKAIQIITKFNPLTEKEQIILQLGIIHEHTKQDTEKKLADIRANIHVKWQATVNLIEDIRRKEEKKYKEEKEKERKAQRKALSEQKIVSVDDCIKFSEPEYRIFPVKNRWNLLTSLTSLLF